MLNLDLSTSTLLATWSLAGDATITAHIRRLPVTEEPSALDTGAQFGHTGGSCHPFTKHAWRRTCPAVHDNEKRSENERIISLFGRLLATIDHSTNPCFPSPKNCLDTHIIVPFLAAVSA